MTELRAATVGTGAPPDDTNVGLSIGYAHGRAFREREDVSLVACADVVPENGAAFAAEFDIDADAVYEDYEEMLAAVEPDIVTVGTPPAHHASVVVGCARSGDVDAVHCEKPMAPTWGECRLMVQEATRHGVQLTFNHQRRFAPRWRRAKELVDGGEIGDVRRVEMGAPDLLDWGTHLVDLSAFYAGDSPPSWVLGGVHGPVDDFYGGAYDHHTETQSVALWAYENGVHALASTGEGTPALDRSPVFNRVVGTDGALEVNGAAADLRIRRDGEGWTEVDPSGASGAFENAMMGALGDVVRGLETGQRPELDARRALNATEVIFGVWESTRRRGRVEFPLDVADNPLESMVEAGQIAVRDEPGLRINPFREESEYEQFEER